MKGLAIYMGISSDDSQHEGIVDHNDVDVIGVLGDPIIVSDGEWDEVASFVPDESRWDVRCENVAGDFITSSDFIGSDRGTINVATKGGFITC